MDLSKLLLNDSGYHTSHLLVLVLLGDHRQRIDDVLRRVRAELIALRGVVLGEILH